MSPDFACDVILKMSLMALIFGATWLSFFFLKTVTCDVEKAYFFMAQGF